MSQKLSLGIGMWNLFELIEVWIIRVPDGITVVHVHAFCCVGDVGLR